MDVRSICLGFQTRGDASGYEIKKLFEDEGCHHFVEASFGSIIPALQRLTEEGYVSVRSEAQEKRPDRKVYSISQSGRSQFIASLLKPLPEDRHRSPFVFAMLFADLLPQSRVTGMVDTYITQVEQKLAHLNDHHSASKPEGDKFVSGFGRAVYVAILDYLRSHRAEIETKQAAEAAE